MSSQESKNAHDALAGLLGLAAHRAIALIRKLLGPSGGDPDRIAVVCDSFLYWASIQAVALRESGLKVTFYYVDRGSDFTGSEEDRTALLAHAEEHDVDLVPVPRIGFRTLLTDVFKLHRDIRRRGIGTLVVHSHGDPRYTTLGLSFPVALIVHDPQIHSGDTISTPPLAIRLISRASELATACVIVHSERLFGQIRPLLRRLPTGVIPLGIEMEATPTAVPSERRLLLFGRLFAYKGVDTALDAFELLPEELSDVTLLVAGRGPLAELARERQNVEVREDYIPDSEVAVMIDQARLVLLPYKDATQSGVGLLAIAHGVPCVVTRTGGLPDLVPGSSDGLIVAPDDPRALADAIVNNIDHGQDLREVVYDHAKTHFSTAVAARRLRTELHRLGICAGETPAEATN
jgi:glycosyltransferase involved in cell wall biosynthesis